MLGYIAFIQANYQLVSPLIPTSTLYLVTETYINASLVTGILLFISLCLYFFQKRILVIITSSIAILSYFIIVNYALL
jgi:hypothetical protein